MRLMPLHLVSVTSWRWTHWLVLAIAAAYVGSYLGLVSWGYLESSIEELARSSPYPEGFEHSLSRQHEALFVVFAFLLLTIPALLALALVVGFVVLVASGAAQPLMHRAGLPESLPRVVVLAVLAGLAWHYQDLWLPSVRWLLALVAGAYLAVSH